MATSNLNDIGEFDYLFRSYFPRLRAFACILVKDNEIAKDIVQDSFIKIWEERFRITSSTFENYLFKSVRNRCINYIRDQKLRNQKLEDYYQLEHYEEIYNIDFMADEPYLTVTEELQKQINEAINDLPKRCQEVFIKSRFEGLKNREIADELGINIKNVERHISTALKKLKSHFGNNPGILLVIEILYKINA